MGGLKIMAPIAWRNLWRRKSRTLLTITAIAMAVASLIILGAFMRAWGGSAFDRTVEALTAHGQIHAEGFLDDPTVEHAMPQPAGVLLDVLSGQSVAAWTPRIVAPGLIRSERESAPIMIYGIDPKRESAVSFLKPNAIDGAPLTSATSKGLIMGRSLADRLQVERGRRVVISAQDENGDIAEIGVRVTGFYKGQPDLQKYAVFVSLKEAQALLGLEGEVSEIAFLAPQRDGINVAIEDLKQAAPDLDIRRWDELQPFAKAMIDLAEGANLIWIFVSFVLVAFGLVNTLMMAVYERMREFGLLQALGMKPVLLLVQILVESVYLVVFGALAGAIAGAVTVNAFSGGLDFGHLGIGAEMFGVSQVLYPKVSAAEITVACSIVIGLSILASLYPALQASRRVPVDVLTRAQT